MVVWTDLGREANGGKSLRSLICVLVWLRGIVCVIGYWHVSLKAAIEQCVCSHASKQLECFTARAPTCASA